MIGEWLFKQVLKKPSCFSVCVCQNKETVAEYSIFSLSFLKLHASNLKNIKLEKNVLRFYEKSNNLKCIK
jgi:hypothetical protein